MRNLTADIDKRALNTTTSAGLSVLTHTAEQHTSRLTASEESQMALEARVTEVQDKVDKKYV